MWDAIAYDLDELQRRLADLNAQVEPVATTSPSTVPGQFIILSIYAATAMKTEIVIGNAAPRDAKHPRWALCLSV